MSHNVVTLWFKLENFPTAQSWQTPGPELARHPEIYLPASHLVHILHAPPDAPGPFEPEQPSLY